MVKISPANAGDVGNSSSVSGSGRSPGGRKDNPFQYSCLENSMEKRSLAGYSLWGHKESELADTDQWCHPHPKI